ncbi:hypothetical protein HF319_02720 [Xanthomonas sp. Kuri4-1]
MASTGSTPGNDQRSGEGHREGTQESRQDRQHDDTAKQRPAQQDQRIHDAESRKPRTDADKAD